MIEQNLMKWQHMTMIYAYHKTGTINSIIRIQHNDKNALFLLYFEIDDIADIYRIYICNLEIFYSTIWTIMF